VEGIGTENIDIGPDAVDARGRGDPSDVLCEPSAWPEERDLPGWRARVGSMYVGLEALGLRVLASLERALSLPPRRLLDCFEGGNSTLTLARHPEPGELVEEIRRALAVPGEDDAACLQLVLPHTDSGCITFVSQDKGAGLQARSRGGEWVPVPAPEGALAVNFGFLLEKWTGGAVKATEHRVIGPERRRTALVFFLEPAIAARIEPLPGLAPFEPTLYGDYVWKRMQRFPDYQNLGDRFGGRQ
jgi:isopenicillin N synthase-like dioxygenase